MKLDDLEKLLADATPGPWTQNGCGTVKCGKVHAHILGDDETMRDRRIALFADADPLAPYPRDWMNAEAVVALWNLAPELIAVVKAVAALREHADDGYLCVMCGKAENSFEVEREHDHTPDCAWVAARRLVGE